MSRRTARRHVFHLVFTLPFGGGLSVEDLAKKKAAYFEFLDEENSRPKGRDAEYIDRAFWGVFERMNELDSVIENFLRDWTISRINKIDLALMRLSIYEMLCEKDVPLGAAVNEAVELAKEYGADESPAFINGVLGNIAREIEKKNL
jgi:N utilization substance protein B